MDYYNILGISFDATAEEVRAAYFDAARRLHPDANPAQGAREQFLTIQQAYEVLRNERQRREYDASLPPQSKQHAAVTLTLRQSRSVIPLVDESQLFYALFDITCTAQPDAAQVAPVHVCIVLDRSTSMKGQRMEMVRSNVLQMLGKLRPQDIFSLVTFSDRAEVVIPPTRVSVLGHIESVLNAIAASGATELYRGLQLGVDVLRRTADSKVLRELIFMTDGHTYGDEAMAIDLAKRAAQDNIKISAFGIGSEWNDDFLDQLVSVSGGICHYVTSTQNLSSFIDSRLKSFEVLYARNLMLEFERHEGVELLYAFRISPDTAVLPIEGAIPLGNLQYGKSVSVLMELSLPPFQREIEEFEIIRGKIKMEIPSSSLMYSRLLFGAKRPVQIMPGRENPPSQIVEAMSQLTLYRLQDKARQEVASGNVLQAAKHLQHLATHLLAKGDRDLAHTVLLEAENVKQHKRYSEDGEKKIKYGTRSLLMLPAPEQKL